MAPGKGIHHYFGSVFLPCRWQLGASPVESSRRGVALGAITETSDIDSCGTADVHPSLPTTHVMILAPRISIGLPVYDGERFLAETVDSILCQTCPDFELILSDNASTDGTADICRKYANLDKRVRYVRNPSNIGVFRNINKTIELSRGEFFRLGSADDLCHPELLAKCLAAMDADSSLVIVCGKTRFISQDGSSLNLTDPGWHLMADSRIERMRYVISSGHWVNVFYGLTRFKDLSQTRLFPSYAGGERSPPGELCLRGKFLELPEYRV